uniref:Uncharacterized protein n=1 Tax=Amphimedon queenslandica TaxID=400682 RepID=A0A1X7VG60_AMPQE
MEVDTEVIEKIQSLFHEVIKSRVASLIEKHNVSLPILLNDVEKDGLKGSWWFPVPGFYGGFSYSFKGEGKDLMLVAESWCRVAGGSGQRHEITVDGYKLVDEEFV